MLPSLKVPPLAWKLVFYRPKYDAKGAPHGIGFLSS